MVSTRQLTKPAPPPSPNAGKKLSTKVQRHLDYQRSYPFYKDEWAISVEVRGLGATRDLVKRCLEVEPTDQPVAKRRKTSAVVADGMMSPVSDSGKTNAIEITPKLLDHYDREWSGLNAKELRNLLCDSGIKYDKRWKENGLLTLVRKNQNIIAEVEEKKRRQDRRSTVDSHQSEDEMEVDTPQTSQIQEENQNVYAKDTAAVVDLDDELREELKTAEIKSWKAHTIPKIQGLLVKYQIVHSQGRKKDYYVALLAKNREEIAAGEVDEQLKRDEKLKKLQQESETAGKRGRPGRRRS